MTHTSRFDEIAPVYDETRGGEKRGDEYAAEIDRLLPEGSGTLLEMGVGTGVVSLGLRKRGRTVVGVDLSEPMLARAAGRLGSSVARGDALRLPVRTSGVHHAFAVWVIHDVADPAARRSLNGLHPTASPGTSSGLSERGRAILATNSTPSATGPGPRCDGSTTKNTGGSPARPSSPWKPCLKKRQSSGLGRSSP